MLAFINRSARSSIVAAVLPVLIILTALLAIPGVGRAQRVAPLVIRGVEPFGVDSAFSAGFWEFQKRIEERSGGAIQVIYIGGPEVFPSFEQTEAVRQGIVDMALMSPAYYAGSLVEGLATEYSTLTLDEERANGALEYYSRLHEERLGIVYAGRAGVYRYTFFTKKPIVSMKDFAGLHLRATPSYLPAVRALGMSAVNIPTGETYTALERGIVDGVAWPDIGIIDQGLHEVVDYRIGPSYWKAGTGIIFNAQFWNGLTQEQRNLIVEVIDDVHRSLTAYYENQLVQEEAVLAAAGVEFLEVAEGDEYVQFVHDAAWDWLVGESPTEGEKLRALFTE